MLSPAEIRLAGVVGAGLMGTGIAKVLAGAGCEVALYDVSPDALERAVTSLRADGVEVTAASSVRDLASGRELVIEAVSENLPLKRAVFAELDEANPGALLATNTSVLPVSEIAAGTTRPDRVVGTHWWNPPAVMPLVEVIRGEHSSTEALELAAGFLRRAGKIAVRIERDVPGFVGNRLQHALWREAIALVADGVCDAVTVDLVVRNTIGLRLARMGPLENADFVGLDLTLAIHEAVLGAINSEPGPSPLLRRMVAGGQLGAKTGQGFLAWPPGARETAADRLAQHVSSQLNKGEEPK